MRYSASMVGLQHMGYVAENRVIQAALAHRLRRPGNLTASLWPVRAPGHCACCFIAQQHMREAPADSFHCVVGLPQASLDALSLPRYTAEPGRSSIIKLCHRAMHAASQCLLSTAPHNLGTLGNPR